MHIKHIILPGHTGPVTRDALMKAFANRELVHLVFKQGESAVDAMSGAIDCLQHEDGSGYSYNLKLNTNSDWHYLRISK